MQHFKYNDQHGRHPRCVDGKWGEAIFWTKPNRPDRSKKMTGQALDVPRSRTLQFHSIDGQMRMTVRPTFRSTRRRKFLNDASKEFGESNYLFVVQLNKKMKNGKYATWFLCNDVTILKEFYQFFSTPINKTAGRKRQLLLFWIIKYADSFRRRTESCMQ